MLTSESKLPNWIALDEVVSLFLLILNKTNSVSFMLHELNKFLSFHIVVECSVDNKI